MKTQTKNLLSESFQYCIDNDKSTEFMLQYMQDTANVSLDCVTSFIIKLHVSAKAGGENLLKTKPRNKLSKKQ